MKKRYFRFIYLFVLYCIVFNVLYIICCETSSYFLSLQSVSQSVSQSVDEAVEVEAVVLAIACIDR